MFFNGVKPPTSHSFNMFFNDGKSSPVVVVFFFCRFLLVQSCHDFEH